MSKKFDNWNDVKKSIEAKSQIAGFKVLPQDDLRASPEGNCKSIVSNKTQKVNKAVGDE